MSRRTNGTNRAGMKLGLNEYKMGGTTKRKGFDLDSLNDKISKKYSSRRKSNALV